MAIEAITKRGVLVADHSQNMAGLVTVMLRSLGRKDIREAYDANKAMTELKRRVFDVLIIDDALDGIRPGQGVVDDNEVEGAAPQFELGNCAVIGLTSVAMTQGAQHVGDERGHMGLGIDDQGTRFRNWVAGHARRSEGRQCLKIADGHHCRVNGPALGKTCCDVR